MEVAQAEATHRAALIYHDKVQGDEALSADDKQWVKDEAVLRLRAAEQAIEAAQMHLNQVRGSARAQMREADAAVQAATARRDLAQAQLDLLQAEPTAEEIAVAQADVAQAQIALDEAQVALERCELRAPFGGTIGEVNVRKGELVTPGEPLITLGDLNTLRVETTDLDEIDVARVAVGQRALVTFDALPEQVWSGHVTRVSPVAEPGAGGVHYTVVIVLDEIAPAVRWGMTAFVDIEVEQ